MPSITLRIVLTLGVLAALPGWQLAEGAGSSATGGPLPTWARANEAIVAHFQSLPDYRPGDLIVRSEVQGLLSHLAKIGWSVPDAKAILAQVPADGEFLATVLRAPTGRKFMRQIGGYRDGYDRLDRLSRMPHGKKTVEALIRGPDGYKMIDYMTSTRGGKNLGRQLSRAPKGKDFNQSTGRIYTVKSLQARLKQSYEAARRGADRSKVTRR